MKNIVSFISLLALLVSGCSQEEMLKNGTPSVFGKGRTFTTEFEQNDSRTYVENGLHSRWTEGDCISLFDASTLNCRYLFAGDTGDSGGTFFMLSKPEDTGTALSTNYAVYPYSEDVKMTEDGVISVTLPSEQHYAENSYGLGDNTMVAVTEDADDTFLSFKNVGGCLKLQFYGDDVTVKSITLMGNNGEKIAGKATITPTYGEVPIVRMDDNATETITLDCGEKGVKIGTTEETATSFWVVLPPTTFAEGFTVTVMDMDGKVFEKMTSNEIIIARNTIHPMQVLKVVCEEVVYDTLLLPDGPTFNSIVGTFLKNNTHLTKIKFVANSNVASQSILVTDTDGTIGYMVANEEWLEIHTSGKTFVANESCMYMFKDLFRSIVEIDFEHCFDTSNVTNMVAMFYVCSNLSSLDISSFDTSNVTNMEYMFGYCSSLTSLDVGSFDTSNVTSMKCMFTNCSSLTSLDVSHFDTSNVTNMSTMFWICSSLASLDVSHFDTSNVTDMRWMFYDCSSLTSLDVSHFETSNVTNMSRMFANCSSLTFLEVSRFDTSYVADMSWMFSYCIGLTSLDVSNFNTSNVTDMRGMFNDCSSLTSLDVSHFNTSNVVDMESMFEACIRLTNLDVSNFNTSNVTDMSWMFSYCIGLTSLDVSNFNTSSVMDMSKMFIDCRSLTSLDVSHFDTSNVTDMSDMFEYCLNLTSLDLTNFSFAKMPEVYNMLNRVGDKTNTQPIPIKVTEAGHKYLIQTTTDCGIGTSAKFVKS